MADIDPANATTTNLTGGVPNYSVNRITLDEAITKNYYYQNNDYSTQLGYYKTIPELKKSIDALIMWVLGLGWKAPDDKTTKILEHIRGNGKETIDSIFANLLINKKIAGDAFAEIIKENNTLLNLKVLNPGQVQVYYDVKGLIDYYKVWEGANNWRRIENKDMFHLINDKVGNETHGNSVIDACKWIIDARNEAMDDYRRVLHRSTIRVLYVEIDDTTTLSTIKTQYKDAIKNKELLVLPVKKGEATLEDHTAPPAAVFLEWIRYLENVFYQAVGVPKIILGGSQDYTEAASKMGHMTFEQPHKTERRLLEFDIWNQLYLRIDFDEPSSIKDNVQTSEAANTGQTKFQPNDFNAQLGRVE